MKFFRLYWSAARYFVPAAVFKDLWKSLCTALLESFFVLVCVVWVPTGLVLALFDVFWPGVLDRWVFQASRR